ncbi:MAG: hypothetical protein NTY83_02670 [Candidatus Micrarchaeota archaeon]|nr:hypothetical protein [Candidatus Micrarchaeota archaeon]
MAKRREMRGFTSAISAMLLLSSSLLLLMMILEVEGDVKEDNADLQRLMVISSIDRNIGEMAVETYTRAGFPVTVRGGDVSVAEARGVSGRLSQNLDAIGAWWSISRRADVSLRIFTEAKTPVFYIMPQDVRVEMRPDRAIVEPADAGSAAQVEYYRITAAMPCENLTPVWNALSTEGETINVTINFTCGQHSYHEFVQVSRVMHSELILMETDEAQLLNISFWAPARVEIVKRQAPDYLNIEAGMNGSARVEIPSALNISMGNVRKDGRVVLR